MENMYRKTARVKLVPKTSITENFIDVKSINHSNYIEVLDKAFNGLTLRTDALKFDFGEYGAEFLEVTDDYFEPEYKACLYWIIMDCFSPMCHVYTVRDNNIVQVAPTSVSRIEGGNILCVHEDGRSVFIDCSEQKEAR